MTTSRQRAAARRRRAAAVSLAAPVTAGPTSGPTTGPTTAERRPATIHRPCRPPAPAGRGVGRSDGDGPPPGARRWVPAVSLVLCLLGLADGVYLTYVHFHPSALVCATNSVFNCAEVQTSPQSMVFGAIPVAILGLAYYVVMMALNLPVAWRSSDVRIAWLRLAGAVAGMGMVLYLVYAELFQIKAICEYCTGVHIVTFVLFVVTVLSFPAVSYRARWLAWHAGEQGDHS